MFVFCADPTILRPFTDKADDRLGLRADFPGHIVSREGDMDAMAVLFRLSVQSTKQKIRQFLGCQRFCHATVILKLKKTI